MHFVKSVLKRPIHVQILILIYGAILFRIIINDIGTLIHIGTVPLFFSSNDIFADSIKQSLAERAITAPLFVDPKVQHWPKIFQQYLFNNPYLGPTISIYAQLPFGLLQLMTVAETIVLFNPYQALFIQFIIYLVFIYALIRLLHTRGTNHAAISVWISCLFLLSYPAICTFDRANYHVAYANIGIAFYLVSAFKNRWRFAGYMALCFAINLRPYLVIFLLIELFFERTFVKAIINQSYITGFTVLTLMVSFVIDKSIDPQYSIQSFLTGYHEFQDTYLIHDDGLPWNVSLFAAIRVLRLMYGAQTSFSEAASALISCLGLLSVGLFIFVALTKRVTKIEAVFVVGAISMLFTSFNGLGHTLKLIGPLLVTTQIIAQRGLTPQILIVWPLVGLIILSSTVAEFVPDGLSATVIILGSVLSVAMCWRMALQICSLRKTENLCLIMLVLALCPIGGSMTIGIVISILLLCTTAIILIGSIGRQPQAAAHEYVL